MNGNTSQETLADMIKSQSVRREERPRPTDLTEEAPQDIEVPSEEEGTTVRMIPLVEWFDQNRQHFSNLRRVRMEVSGIDPNKFLLLSAIKPGQINKAESEAERELFLLKDTDRLKVPNIPGRHMHLFPKGYMITFSVASSDLWIKGYSIPTGLHVIFCVLHNNQYLPFFGKKVHRSENTLDLGVDIPRIDDIQEILRTTANADLLVAKYHQIEKAINNLNTYQEVVNWLISRQMSFVDSAHLIQLDEALISIFS